MAKLNYDEKCEELARHFLGANASDEKAQEFAAFIQHNVELWMTYEEAEQALGRLALQDGEGR